MPNVMTVLKQADFAKLVGVSAQSVVLWESKPAMLKLREATKAAVFAVRSIGAKKARQRLAEIPAVKQATAERRKKR